MLAPSPLGTGGLDRFIRGLVIAAYGLMLTLSAFGLTMLGWDYTVAGGSPITRFHPSSYPISLAFLLVLAREGNLFKAGWRTLRADARFALYLVAWGVLAYQVIFVQQIISSFLFDTYLMPLFVIVVMDRVDPATRRTLALMAHIGFMANSALGVAEFVGGFRLTPIVLLGVADEAEWRSTALLGHPLSNALLTGVYGVALLAGGGRMLSGKMRLLALLLTHLGLVVFGGRTALVLLLLFDALALGLGAMRLMAGARLRLGVVAMVALVLPLVPFAIGFLIQSGFFDKMIERFMNDAGSASTRVIMFEMFRHFSWNEILFGPPQAYLAHLQHMYGTEYGIESTWVAFVYYLGLAPSALFWVGLALLVWALVDRCDRRVLLVLLYFFIIISSFLGIAGKTHSLSLLFLTLMVLLPKPSPHRAPAPGWGPQTLAHGVPARGVPAC